jgi:AmiR/NasT family two-component response regulator
MQDNFNKDKSSLRLLDGRGSNSSNEVPSFLKVVDASQPASEITSATRYHKYNMLPTGTTVAVATAQEQTARQLVRTLSRAGLTVTGQAADGRQALELARTLSPDVLLIDLDLPQIDGVGVTKAIRQERPRPVVLLSQIGDGFTREKALEAGASALLVLPLLRDALIPGVITALMRFRIEEEVCSEFLERAEREEVRCLVEQAVNIMIKRWHLPESEALRQIGLRTRRHRNSIRQTAMEVIGADLFH